MFQKVDEIVVGIIVIMYCLHIFHQHNIIRIVHILTTNRFIQYHNISQVM